MYVGLRFRSVAEARGLQIERHYTNDDGSPREEVAYRTTSCEIRNPDGSVVFAQQDVEVPAGWSQVASDVLAQKYFRKAGIVARRKPVPEDGVPEWLWRSAPDPDAEAADAGADAEAADDKPTQGERSAKEVFHRLAGTWTYWGWKAATSTAKIGRPAPSTTSSSPCWRPAGRRAQLAPVVQHRPALGLRHRRAGARATTTSISSPAT